MKFLSFNANITPIAYVYQLILYNYLRDKVECLAADVLLNRSSVGLLTWVTWWMISIGTGGSSLEMFLLSVASALCFSSV